MASKKALKKGEDPTSAAKDTSLEEEEKRERKVERHW